MATARISKRSVDAAVPGAKKSFLWDDQLRGFGLQVTPAGAKSYVYQYRTGGRESPKRRFTIGRHGSPWNPTSAREECERLAMLVAQGIDPSQSDRERRRQAVDLAFTAYIETFTNGYLKRRWKDWRGAERLLRGEPAAVLKDKPLPTITRSDVVAILDKYDDRPAAAARAFAILRKLFRWAEGRGDIERSPISDGFSAPQTPKARDRVLSDEELLLVWKAADTLGYPFGPMYRLLIATGARRDEVAALDWSELDQAEGSWTLPPARAKNGQSHLIPLNNLAIELIDALPGTSTNEEGKVIWPKTGLVFTTTGDTAVSGYSRAKVRLDRAVEKIVAEKSADTVQPWRVHDLRRTVATGLQRLGVRFEVTEAILNHVSGSRSGVAGVYQRHDWKVEKRTALEAWGNHIRSLLNAASKRNVISLHRTA